MTCFRRCFDRIKFIVLSLLVGVLFVNLVSAQNVTIGDSFLTSTIPDSDSVINIISKNGSVINNYYSGGGTFNTNYSTFNYTDVNYRLSVGNNINVYNYNKNFIVSDSNDYENPMVINLASAYLFGSVYFSTENYFKSGGSTESQNTIGKNIYTYINDEDSGFNNKMMSLDNAIVWELDSGTFDGTGKNQLVIGLESEAGFYLSDVASSGVDYQANITQISILARDPWFIDNGEGAATYKGYLSKRALYSEGDIGLSKYNKIFFDDVFRDSYISKNGIVSGTTYIGFDGRNLIVNVSGGKFNKTDGLLYVVGNISAAGFVTRTDVWTADRGRALSAIKNYTDLTVAGKPKDENFGLCSYTYDVIDYDRGVKIIEEKEIKKNDKIIKVNITNIEYPFTKNETGVKMDCIQAKHEQAIYELKQGIKTCFDKWDGTTQKLKDCMAVALT